MRRSTRARKPSARALDSTDNEQPSTPIAETKQKKVTTPKKQETSYYDDEPPLVEKSTPKKSSPKKSNLGKRKRTPTKTKTPAAKVKKVAAPPPEESDFEDTNSEGDSEAGDREIVEKEQPVASEEDEELSEAELPRKTNQKLTARQRSLLSKGEDKEDLQSLPMETKKVMTEEEKNKKSEQARRRKRLAERQAEEEIRTVIEKLMNKIEKTKDDEAENIAIDAARKKESLGPCIHFQQKKIGESGQVESSVSFPVDYDLSFLFQPKLKEPKELVKCAVKDCNSLKRFSCAFTKRPLCSLECYKKLQNSKS